MNAKIAEHTIRNTEWDTYAQNVLDNSDLVGDQYSQLYDDIMNDKTTYANADKKTQDLMKRDLVVMASDYEDYKALREDVAVNLDDYSPAFTNSETGKAYLDILKGEGKKLIRKDGRIGIEVNGEFTSIAGIKQQLDNNKIDDTSIEALESFRIVARDSTKPFNYSNTKTDIMNNLIYKGSYNSLKNDEIIPGRIFRNDLATSLMNKTYSDLGIKEQDFEGIEGVNINDGISAVEAENIIANLEQNEAEMKEVMADYYTSYIKQNASDVIDPASNGGYTKEEAMDLQRNLVEQGYLKQSDVDGIYGQKTIEAQEKYEKGEPPSTDNTNENTSEQEVPVDEDNIYTPLISLYSEIRDDEAKFKINNNSENNFRRILNSDGFNESVISSDDIQSYFKDAENKKFLNQHAYYYPNFEEWLKRNNKNPMQRK
jgi:hypothetical protein